MFPRQLPNFIWVEHLAFLYEKTQHFALWLSPKISPNAAPATKRDNPTSRNTNPATKKSPSNSSQDFKKLEIPQN